MKRIFWALLSLTLVVGCERAPTTTEPVPSSAPVTTTSVSEATRPVQGTPSAPSPVVMNPEQEQIHQQALALKQQGKLADARALLDPIANTPNPPDQILELLGDINTQILFTPVPAPEKTDYTIQPGDSLGKLSRQFGATIELIKKSNNLASDLIRVGDRLRIYQGQFAVRVNKTANTLTVTDHDRFLKRYRVGTGEFGKTPVGAFKITDRIVHPPWYRGDAVIPYGDKENILGTHWLGFDIRGYGIHGTWDNSSIGKQATAGCVRLANQDVEELFIMLPTGTPVTIHE